MQPSRWFWPLALLAVVAHPITPSIAQVPLPELKESPKAKLPAYPEPADLADALQRAEKALSLAEKRGPDAQEKIDEANYYVNLAFRFDPQNTRALFYFARLNILVGRESEALAQVLQYVDSAVGQIDWEAYKLLGDLYYQGSYWAQAQQKYKWAARLNPSQGSIYIGLARCAIKRNQHAEELEEDQAVEYARQATELAPDSASAWEVYATALLSYQPRGSLVAQQRLQSAKEAADRAISLAARNAAADPINLRHLDDLKGFHDLLQLILRTMIQRDPTQASRYLDYAKSVRAEADLSWRISVFQAMTIVRTGIKATQPNPPKELLDAYGDLLTRVLKATGDARQAVSLLQRIVEIDPGDVVARQLLQAVLEDQKARLNPAVTPQPEATNQPNEP